MGRRPIAIASSAACGFPIALAGTVGYIWAGRHLPMPPGTVGDVHPPSLACISLASVLTAPWGACVAHRTPTATLKRLFSGLLFALGAHIMGRALTA